MKSITTGLAKLHDEIALRDGHAFGHFADPVVRQVRSHRFIAAHADQFEIGLHVDVSLKPVLRPWTARRSADGVRRDSDAHATTLTTR
jgi:hypothetical protein